MKNNKKTFLVLCSLSLAFAFTAWAEDPPNCPAIWPIPIASLADLAKIGHDPCHSLTAEYVLMQDIDASASREMNGGGGFMPIGAIAYPCVHPPCLFEGAFGGKFDGKGYAIRGLYINHSDAPGANVVADVGLFATIAAGAVVQNLVVEADSVVNPRNAGVLTGVNLGTVANVSVSGTVVVNGAYAGGLAGENFGGIADSRADVTVVSKGNNSAHIGGLIGANGSNGTIASSFATGYVSGVSAVGGLVGSNGGYIINCYAAGDADGLQKVGGLVGDYGPCPVLTDIPEEWIPPMIQNSYSVGRVMIGLTGGIGGLIGAAGNSCNVVSSYWDISASGHATSSSGEGKTTAEMKARATFVGWDFEAVWAIDEGVSYPYFRYLDAETSVRGGDVARSRSVKNGSAASVSVRGRTLSVSSPNNSALSIRMIDMRGKTIAKFNVGTGLAPARPLSFPLTKIPAGRYFVEVRDGVRRDRSSVVVGVK